MSESINPSPEINNHLTFNIFWAEYGHKLGLGSEAANKFWEDANSKYGVLPQHNFLHAKQVLWEAMGLADNYEARGKEVNRDALFLATLYHDAGLGHPDELKKAYGSDESYSAYLMFQAGMMHGYEVIETSTLQTAANIILASDATVTPITIEEKIMVRADLANVSGDYSRDFLGTTGRLWQEQQNKPGHLSESEFIAKNIGLLATYLSRDLSLWPGEPQDWLWRSIQNIKQLAADEAAQNGQSTEDYLHSLNSAAVQAVLLDSPLAA